jgi:hypothetical protein
MNEPAFTLKLRLFIKSFNTQLKEKVVKDLFRAHFGKSSFFGAMTRFIILNQNIKNSGINFSSKSKLRNIITI